MYQIITFYWQDSVSIDEQFNEWARKNDETIREVLSFVRDCDNYGNERLTVLYKTRR